MTERTVHDNQTLLAFWDRFYALSEEDQEGARQEGIGPWEGLAPSEKLLNAACSLGDRKRILDFGCGNGWASIAAAKSGCKDVTAADPAANAVDTVRFIADLFSVSTQVHPVCGGSDWLKTVPAETYDGMICSNVLDVVPPETAEDILREMARVVTADAQILIGLNYFMSPESAAQKGLALTDDRLLYQDGVLRLVSRTDAEWASLFAPFFVVESMDYYAWPGETEEKRRLFRLRKKQTD